ncbi:MAG TPA: ComEC/Rec2 family competence protein [Azospirillaceae bacterium]|nr:ComEC/Rec2 family competence protein [Azospirillaceae bacterium]
MTDRISDIQPAPASERPTVPLARAVGNTVQAERERLALWLPVLMASGVVAHFAIASQPHPAIGIVAFCAAALGWLVVRRAFLLSLVAAAVLAVTGGYLSAQIRTALVSAPVLEKPVGSAAVAGRVLAVDRMPGGPRVLLGEVRVEGLVPERTPARVRIRLRRSDAAPEPGALIRVRAVLRPPPGPVEPDAFDFRRNAFFDRIGGMGFAVGRLQRIEGPPAGPVDRIALWFAKARQHVADRVAAAVDGPSAAITTALLNGQQTGIDAQVIRWFRDSGLAHLLSISGLHIGLVAGGILFVVRAGLAAMPPVALRLPIKKIAAVVSLLVAGGYTLLVGAPVPTARSMLMVGLVLLAVLTDRTAISMRTVAFAAVVVIALAPDSVLGVSFQMSFAAVAALTAAYEVLQPRLRMIRSRTGWIGKGALHFGAILISSVVATMATAPFSLFHFQQLSVHGVLANMAAIPLTAFWIMPAGIVAGLLMPFGVESPALVAMGWGVDVLIEVARVVADLPGALVRVPAVGDSAFLLVVGGGLWLCLWRTRLRVWGLLGVLAGGTLAVVAGERPAVLLSDDGRLAAVRAADGTLVLSSARAGRFHAENWRRRDGADPEARSPVFPRNGRSVDGVLDCDAQRCFYRRHGVTVAFIMDRAVLTPVCRTAQIVVTDRAAPYCRAPRVIHRWDRFRKGVHAIHIEADGSWRVETVRDRQGEWPWSVR